MLSQASKEKEEEALMNKEYTTLLDKEEAIDAQEFAKIPGANNPHQAPKARRPIGFHGKGANTDKQTVSTNQTQSANSVSAKNANSVCTPKKGTITHYDFRTGTPKEMTVRDLKRMVAIYDKRVAERKEELEKQGDYTEDDHVLIIRMTRAKYWYHLLVTLKGRLLLQGLHIKD